MKKEREISIPFRIIIFMFMLFGIAMFYIYTKKLSAIHFSTMDIQSLIIGVFITSCIFSMLMYKVLKQSIYDGLVLGLILSTSSIAIVKSYIKLHNENNITNVQYYEMKLDDYDKYQNDQRWLLSIDAMQIMGREKEVLYISGDDVNKELTVDKTYNIPIAVGMFNDVFIPRDSFKNAEVITVD